MSLSPPATSSRILRGYGPLLAFALLFLLMAAFVPTVGEQVRTVQGGSGQGPSGAARPPVPAARLMDGDGRRLVFRSIP